MEKVESKIDINALIKIISEGFDITEEMLCSKKKTDAISKARHTLYHTLHKIGFRKNRIAIMLDKDHTSVIHGLGVYKNLYETDDEFRSKAKDVEIKVNQYIYEQTKK